MPTIKVQLEGGEELLKEMKRLGIAVDEVLGAAVLAGADIIQRAANPNAPGPHVEIGDVKKSKHSAEVDVGPDDDHWYYKFAETGAVPHSITGVPLRFYKEGEAVFAWGVQHPGRAAAPFLRPALDENQKEAETAMGEKVRGAVLRGTSGG